MMGQSKCVHFSQLLRRPEIFDFDSPGMLSLLWNSEPMPGLESGKGKEGKRRATELTWCPCGA